MSHLYFRSSETPMP